MSGVTVLCLPAGQTVGDPAQVEKNKDNILPRVMAVSGSYDKLFAEELRKYDPLKVGPPGRCSSQHALSIHSTSRQSCCTQCFCCKRGSRLG